MALYAETLTAQRWIFKIRKAFIETQHPFRAAERAGLKNDEMLAFLDDYPHLFRDVTKDPCHINRGLFATIIANAERDTILIAMEESNWNKQKAAQILGINRTTLVEKCQKYLIYCNAENDAPTSNAE